MILGYVGIRLDHFGLEFGAVKPIRDLMAGPAILIYEDDESQAQALVAAFTRAGFQAYNSTRADEVKEMIESKKIRYLFVDCLLPGMSGVDFVASIRNQYPSEVLDVILMSGIFTDAIFMKDAIRLTQAISFLKKPFGIEDALRLVKADEEPKAKSEYIPRKALYSIFSKDKISLREKRKVIESLEEIHGYDLPFIYSLLIESKMSGHLNIVGKNGEVSGISFSQGAIVAVDIADQETLLGNLLIESGFVLPEDLEPFISVSSPKKMGERLIHGSVLSPHAFNIVLSSQMSIRLSRTIINSSVTINFVETEVEFTMPQIDSDSLLKFLHDWVAGKITLEWLKTHYLQWGSQKLAPGPLYSDSNPALEMPIVSSMQDFVKSVTSGLTVNEMADSQKFPEESFYKAIHFLLLKGLLIILESEKIVAQKDLSKYLKKIETQFQGRNKFEVFDMMARITSVSEAEPQKVYSTFLAMIGENKELDAPEAKAARKKISDLAKESFEFARSGNREKLQEEMAKLQLEARLKAQSQFEEAKNSLQRAQYAVALQLIEKAVAVEPGLEKNKILLAWAKLGLLESGVSKPGVSLKSVQMDLIQVAPEDKFDALFSFVTGLYCRATGDLLGAKKAFEKAVNMDSTMIVARRELTKTVGQSGAKKDVMNRDLKDLVSNFFSKKK